MYLITPDVFNYTRCTLQIHCARPINAGEATIISGGDSKTLAPHISLVKLVPQRVCTYFTLRCTLRCICINYTRSGSGSRVSCVHAHGQVTPSSPTRSRARGSCTRTALFRSVHSTQWRSLDLIAQLARTLRNCVLC